MFFVAAIIGLPEELYQAAELDGASGTARFRYLTLPLLRRHHLLRGRRLHDLGSSGLRHGARPDQRRPGHGATTTVIFRVWQYVFGSNNKVGFAAAISLVLIVAILAPDAAPDALLRARRGGD